MRLALCIAGGGLAGAALFFGGLVLGGKITIDALFTLLGFGNARGPRAQKKKR